MDDNDGRMIFGEPWGTNASWHLSYRWGKTSKKPHPGNLSRPGIEPGPAAWQARMLPLAPRRAQLKWRKCWRMRSSFSSLSVTSPTSQLILQPFRRFTYVTFSNTSVASPTSQLILQPFRRFTYVTFFNTSVASPTSQLILQPFFGFSYVTGSSPGEPHMSNSLVHVQKSWQLSNWGQCCQYFLSNLCTLQVMSPTSHTSRLPLVWIPGSGRVT